MIVLPTGAFIVLQDEAVAKEIAKNSLIISLEEHSKNLAPSKPNTGTIVYTSKELNEYQLCKVVFRETYADNIKIDDKELLFFRDFNSSIYYVITE